VARIITRARRSRYSERWRMVGIAAVLKKLLRVESHFVELAAAGGARAADGARAALA
jgi:hypothetical protein